MPGPVRAVRGWRAVGAGYGQWGRSRGRGPGRGPGTSAGRGTGGSRRRGRAGSLSGSPGAGRGPPSARGGAGHTPNGRLPVMTGRAPVRKGRPHDNDLTTRRHARTVPIRTRRRPRVHRARRPRRGPRPGFRPRPRSAGGEHVRKRLRRPAPPRRQPLRGVRGALGFRCPDPLPGPGESRRLLGPLPRGEGRDRRGPAGRAGGARRAALEGLPAARRARGGTRGGTRGGPRGGRGRRHGARAGLVGGGRGQRPGAVAPLSSLLPLLPAHPRAENSPIRSTRSGSTWPAVRVPGAGLRPPSRRWSATSPGTTW